MPEVSVRCSAAFQPGLYRRVARQGQSCTQCGRERNIRWTSGISSARTSVRERSVQMRAGERRHPSFFYWDGCPTFIQCPNCRSVFALESEEIAGEPRQVLCSMCLHEWQATEREIIWGEDAALQSLESAPDRPVRRRPRTRKFSRDGNSLSVFVGGLSYACTEDDLFSAFCAFGEVSRCQIPQKSGSPRGIGFVEFRNKEHALKAIQTLDGASILGRRISLSIANEDTRVFDDGKIVEDDIRDAEIVDDMDGEEEDDM